MESDAKALADLVEFVRIERTMSDIEPWADIIAAASDIAGWDAEQTGWVVKGYNGYDTLLAGVSLLTWWPGGIREWYSDPDRDRAATLECTQERRGLRGGRVLKHLSSYADHIHSHGGSTHSWLTTALAGDDPLADFDRLLTRLRLVWGVGRQTAFEWAEFGAKCLDLPITAPEAHLWESTGPRRSLERIWSGGTVTNEWLDEAAARTRDHLTAALGYEMPWEDFETVICDFNVMRDGRYYPGRHLAALREEVEAIPEPWRETVEAAWARIVPERWQRIAPGIDKTLMPVYRDTGRIVTP
jgi:Alpha-glutamyl/putrescinyl thymine pyrophosphorylase clade 2